MRALEAVVLDGSSAVAPYLGANTARGRALGSGAYLCNTTRHVSVLGCSDGGHLTATPWCDGAYVPVDPDAVLALLAGLGGAQSVLAATSSTWRKVVAAHSGSLLECGISNAHGTFMVDKQKLRAPIVQHINCNGVLHCCRSSGGEVSSWPLPSPPVVQVVGAGNEPIADTQWATS